MGKQSVWNVSFGWKGRGWGGSEGNPGWKLRHLSPSPFPSLALPPAPPNVHPQSLGTGNNLPHPSSRPARVFLQSNLAMTRVKKIACSSYHCAAVTDVGLLFTWGTGADGALGHGNEDDVLEPKVVETFGVGPPVSAEDAFSPLPPSSKRRKIVLVKDVGCGADILGAHTAAVTTGGQVYTWGLAGAIGHFGRPSSVPKVLGPMPGNEDGANDDDEEDDDDEGALDVDDMPLYKQRTVSIACGGGFTLAVTAAGWVWVGRMGEGGRERGRERKGEEI